jgi:hypothetical protein
MILATLDLETDPFAPDRIVQPFLSGFYTGSKFASIWDDDPIRVIDRTVSLLEKEEPSCIYIHNGGRFDLFYFLKHVSGSLKIINNRIVSCTIGRHEIRDSYAIMPFPLSSYAKKEIDYAKLEKRRRDANRAEILEYLRADCVYLYELVTAFHAEFGDKLTIGGASMAQLKKRHKFVAGGPEYDTRIRKDYYYGGRNQCFNSGVIYAPLKVYDVNSMYLHVMRSMLHPVSTGIELSRRIQPNTCFVCAEGRNYGAFPVRTKTGLDFTVPYGRFHTTIHEWRAALETGTFRPERIVKTYNYSQRAVFDGFVNHFFEQRLAAKAANDPIRDLLYKYTGNSCYGKFAQNPDNFWDYEISPADEAMRSEPCPHCRIRGGEPDAPGSGLCPSRCHICERLNGFEPTDECLYCMRTGLRWAISESCQNWIVWQARPERAYYHNVATGSSITGGARSILLRGLACAIRPVYCDTDSIICEGERGLPLHNTDLGAWKLEAAGDCIAIAGKKLYAVFAFRDPGPDKRGRPAERVRLPQGEDAWTLKIAAKGVRMTGKDILRVAQGEVVPYVNPVPAYQLDGSVKWMIRNVRSTAGRTAPFGDRALKPRR